MKKVLFLLILLSCCCNAFTQSTYTDDSTVMVDTGNMLVAETLDTAAAFANPIVREISADSIHVLKNDKAFAYMQYIDSFFRHHKFPEQEIVKTPETEDQPGLFTNPGLRTLYWLLAITAALWLVWKLLIGQSSIFTTNRKLRKQTFEDDTASQEDKSFEYLIDKAISERNYRLATRYLYLQTLALLGEQYLVTLAPQKTNYQYMQELNGHPQQQSFSALTLQYEYAWYGNFALSASQFEIIQRNFKSFITTLK